MVVVVGGIGMGSGCVGVGACVSARQALDCFRGSIHRSVFRRHRRRLAVVASGHTNTEEQHKLAQRVGATMRQCETDYSTYVPARAHFVSAVHTFDVLLYTSHVRSQNGEAISTLGAILWQM